MSHYRGAGLLIVNGEPVSVHADLVAYAQNWWGLLHLYTPSPLTRRTAAQASEVEIVLPSGLRGRLSEVNDTPDGLEVSGEGDPPFGEQDGLPAALTPAIVPGITAGLVSLEEARKRKEASAETYDGLVCGCGEAWFRFGPQAAVCLSREGAITGYSGILFCTSCGERA